METRLTAISALLLALICLGSLYNLSHTLESVQYAEREVSTPMKHWKLVKYLLLQGYS
jgi:hypothetical protein